VILRLAVSVEHRLVTDRQTTKAYTALAWRRTVMNKPGIERVQALADISRSRAPIANPPNSAQLGGTPYHSPKLHPGPCIVWECGEGQTQAYTHTDARDQNTFRVIHDSPEMYNKDTIKVSIGCADGLFTLPVVRHVTGA